MLDLLAAGVEEKLRSLRRLRAHLVTAQENQYPSVSTTIGEAVEALDIAADSLSDVANSLTVAFVEVSEIEREQP